jgi:flavin reductase (DIM6/NTAB) family NADH-FMN oxidoreductase RutF
MIEGSPPVSVEAFRAGMSRLGAAVNIVTTDGPAGKHGITASAVCSVTDSPPTLLVCVNRSSSAHDIIVGNGTLCVNVLGHGHEQLAMLFGRPGVDPSERFAVDRWTTLVTGAPRLQDATVAFDCRVIDRHAVGTHSVIFSEVVGIATAASGQGLVYFDRHFHALGPRGHAESPSEPEADGSPAGQTGRA